MESKEYITGIIAGELEKKFPGILKQILGDVEQKQLSHIEITDKMDILLGLACSLSSPGREFTGLVEQAINDSRYNRNLSPQERISLFVEGMTETKKGAEKRESFAGSKNIGFADFRVPAYSITYGFSGENR